MFICKYEGCGFQTYIKKEFGVHIHKVHDGNFTCDVADCNFTTKNKYYLSFHMKEYHRDIVIYCGYNDCKYQTTN